MSAATGMIVLFALMWAGIGASAFGLHRFLLTHEKKQRAGEKTFDHGL